MWVKILLNVLYNIGIFICLLTIYLSAKNHNWAYVAGATFLAVMVIVFKIRLVKDIRNLQKKQ